MLPSYQRFHAVGRITLAESKSNKTNLNLVFVELAADLIATKLVEKKTQVSVVKAFAEAKEWNKLKNVVDSGKNDAAKELAQQLLERQESKKE